MKKNSLKKLVIILILLIPGSGFAEIITLKSGKQIEGKIIERNDQYIKVEFDDREVYYELKYVVSIDENKDYNLSQKEKPSLKNANFYLKEGLGYASQAKFIEAEKEFRKGLEMNTADHNLQEALKMISDLKGGIIKEDYALYLFKGSHYLINAQYKEAVLAFQEALKLKPLDADLNYYLGVCHYSLEEYEDALNYLRKAQEAKPNDAEIYYYLGSSYYSLGQYEEAINFLEKTVEINPDDAEAYSILGASHNSLGQNQQAKENFNKAQQIFQSRGDYL